MPRAALLAAAVLATVVVACGGDDLSRADGDRLAISRDRIAAALATYRELEDSPAVGERLVARARKIVASGALEPRQLDEFGLAALGELRLIAPSLVIVDRIEIPRELDRPALTAFLEHARTDPSAATKPAAESAIAEIDSVLDATGTTPESEIPVVDETVAAYLDALESRLRPVWPDLADDIAVIHSSL